MKTYESQNSADEDRTLEDETSSGNECEKGDELHAGSIASTEAVTPARFMARLRHELDRRGISHGTLPRLTAPGETPPCFKLSGANYDQWLATASLLGATVPYRYDMPGEPNYCWDCTSAFKGKAKAAGVCRFPGTRFERVQTVIRDEQKKVIEVEIVGISRRKHLQFEGSRIDELLREHVSAGGGEAVQSE
jgi:hypothetical protein